jgi:predicted SnoaL-like aldol condensation-catalyzing enzyme
MNSKDNSPSDAVPAGFEKRIGHGTSTEANKQSAVEFLKMVIAGNIQEAYEKYIDARGKHHNAYTPAGFPALQKGMEDAHLKFPNKQFTIQRVIGDADLVAVHSHLVLEKGKLDLGVVHLFRFDGGKIVEMWDLGQAAPSQEINKDGIF